MQMHTRLAILPKRICPGCRPYRLGMPYNAYGLRVAHTLQSKVDSKVQHLFKAFIADILGTGHGRPATFGS